MWRTAGLWGQLGLGCPGWRARWRIWSRQSVSGTADRSGSRPLTGSIRGAVAGWRCFPFGGWPVPGSGQACSFARRFWPRAWRSGACQRAESLAASTLVSASCVAVPGRSRGPASTTPEGGADDDLLSAVRLDSRCCGWLRVGDDGHDGGGLWPACAVISGCGVAASARAASWFAVVG